MVGEAFVETAQQRHVDGGGHAVPPFPVHQHREQVPVQIVHRVVFFADPGGFLRVAGQHHLLCAVTQFDCDSAHFGEISVDFFGQCVLGMASAGDLGDVQGQCAHPVDIGHHLDGAHDRSQVTGDRCLQGQQYEGALFGAGARLRRSVHGRR